MMLDEVIRLLDAKVLAGELKTQAEVGKGYASDMLSDVMANAKEGQMWFTIQTHLNVIAVALLLNLGAIVITGGHQPEEDVIEKAKAENVFLISTCFSTFDAIVRLSKAGIIQ